MLGLDRRQERCRREPRAARITLNTQLSAEAWSKIKRIKDEQRSYGYDDSECNEAAELAEQLSDDLKGLQHHLEQLTQTDHQQLVDSRDNLFCTP